MMSERFRHSSGIGYTYTSTTKMENDFSPKKTMIILVVVVGCFAVLWPKVFYPMLVGSANQHMKPSAIDKTTGCCYVLSEIDVDTIKIMSELCGNIIKDQMGEAPLTGKQIISICQDEVFKTCGIDISAVLQEQVRLGQTTKEILDQIRSLNGSLCLKYNFGVAPWRLGVPHIITLRNISDSVRQERPAHVRSEMLHPAFKERGRAIPQTASPSHPPPKIIDGTPGPIPSMRPTMGGSGHVPAKQGTGSMGVIMPIYTIGIVVFFTYTLMKVIFKKHPDTDTIYSTMEQDTPFRKNILGENSSRSSSGSCKLVVKAMSALLDEVDQEIEARRQSSECTMQDENSSTTNLSNGSIKKDEKPSVKIMAMETSESCEGGKKWQSVNSSVLPNVPSFVNEPVTPPQEIYLDRTLSPQSQILVTDSATETESNSGDDPAVVLAGKMTLSVISLENENIEIDEIHNVDKHEIIEREILKNSKQIIEAEINNLIEDAIENLGFEKLDVVVISEETKEEGIQKDIISKPSEENGHITLTSENFSDAEKLKNELILEVKDNIIKENELFQTIEVNQERNLNSEQMEDLASIVKNGDVRDTSKISSICNKENFLIENALEVDVNSEKTESSEKTSCETSDGLRIAHTSDVMDIISPSENNRAAIQTQFLNSKSLNEVQNEFETAEIQLSNYESSSEAPINVLVESSIQSDISRMAPNQLSEDQSSNKANNEFKIAQAKSLTQSDKEFKTSHAPPLNTKSSSEDSGSTVHSVSNQGSVINVSTRDVENETKPEEEYYVSEEEEESDEESEEEIEVSEDEDIEENEINRDPSELTGRLNANGDAIFINGAEGMLEDNESDEEEEAEEIIEEYSEEEDDESADETNDVGHVSSNGNRD